jgi:hypothetical protein
LPNGGSAKSEKILYAFPRIVEKVIIPQGAIFGISQFARLLLCRPQKTAVFYCCHRFFGGLPFVSIGFFRKPLQGINQIFIAFSAASHLPLLVFLGSL